MTCDLGQFQKNGFNCGYPPEQERQAFMGRVGNAVLGCEAAQFIANRIGRLSRQCGPPWN